jgi:ribosomal protein L40E
MIVCKKCGYENPDDALYCNLCKEIFRKEKREKPMTVEDLPPHIRELLEKQRAEVERRFSFTLGIDSKRIWIFIVIVGMILSLSIFFLLFCPR